MSVGVRRNCSRVGLLVALTSATLSTAAGGASEMSDGVERIIAELREREATLENKERDLTSRERSISELEGQVNKRIEELEAMRAEVEERIEDWSSSDADRIKRLAKVYSEMPPGKVAPLLQGLDRDLATSILSSMKEKKTAAVLAVMPKSQALMLSNRYAKPLASDTDTER